MAALKCYTWVWFGYNFSDVRGRVECSYTEELGGTEFHREKGFHGGARRYGVSQRSHPDGIVYCIIYYKIISPCNSVPPSYSAEPLYFKKPPPPSTQPPLPPYAVTGFYKTAPAQWPGQF